MDGVPFLVACAGHRSGAAPGGGSGKSAGNVFVGPIAATRSWGGALGDAFLHHPSQTLFSIRGLVVEVAHASVLSDTDVTARRTWSRRSCSQVICSSKAAAATAAYAAAWITIILLVLPSASLCGREL